MGEIDSSTYGFYVKRVARRTLINDAEIELREALLMFDPNITRIHGIGAGIGTLALAFVIAGIDDLALERDRRRVGTMRAIHTPFEVAHPTVACNYSRVLAVFANPSVENLRLRETVAVLTNSIATKGEKHKLRS